MLELGFEAKTAHVKDDYAATKAKIESQLENNDVLIMTGGVSVGDYDFVEKAFAEIGINKVFHKVNQKTGKAGLFWNLWKKTCFWVTGKSCGGAHLFLSLHSSCPGKTQWKNATSQKERSHPWRIISQKGKSCPFVTWNFEGRDGRNMQKAKLCHAQFIYRRQLPFAFEWRRTSDKTGKFGRCIHFACNIIKYGLRCKK